MITIYVLKCSNNKYYVGKTLTDVDKRFNTHKKGQGAIWTRKYRPIEILNVYKNCDHFDEDKYTKMYMDKYGIENVRGGSYTKVKLNDDVIKFLEKELSSIHDKCFEYIMYKQTPNLKFIFMSKKDSKIKTNNLIAWYFILVFRNLVGYSLILGGIIMLVLPGQGLFTIIIGLMLSNYPGKYSLEKRFIAIPTILKSINWLRKKSNKPPLKII